MRRILIDALSPMPQLALADGDKEVLRATGDAKDRAQALDEALKAILPLNTIDEIVTISGPGNFTAIRAGLGFARGLAMAFGAPSRGISILQLDAIAGQIDHGHIYRDARGGRLYRGLIENKTLVAVELVSENDAQRGHSADLEGFTPIATNNMLDLLLQSARLGQGETPARAFYVRAADAAPSSLKVPKLLDA